jgi:hypothetical protein
LELGQIARALTAFSGIETASPTLSVTRKGYYLALEIRIRMLRGDVQGIEALISELEKTHRQMRSVGSQDFEIYSLYLGLSAIGDKNRGVALLQDYVLRHRRSKYPVPPSIAAVATLNAYKRAPRRSLSRSDERKPA